MVVYTAIIGDFDTLHEPSVRSRGVRYVCFADTRPTELNGWEIVNVERSSEPPRLQHRYYKILSHRMFPDDEISLYIDGNFELLVDPLELAETYLADSDLALFRHPQRDGVYEELEACAALGKDAPETLAAVEARYRALGMPETGFLHAAGFLLRRHTQDIVDFNEAWYEELLISTFRDQPSLALASWRTGLGQATIDMDIWNNDFFNYHPHKLRKSD